jgi:hypothetical protein
MRPALQVQSNLLIIIILLLPPSIVTTFMRTVTRAGIESTRAKMPWTSKSHGLHELISDTATRIAQATIIAINALSLEFIVFVISLS